MKDAEGLDLAAEYANHSEKAYKDLKNSVLNAHGKTANKNHAQPKKAASNLTLGQREHRSKPLSFAHTATEKTNWSDAIRQNVEESEKIYEATEHVDDKPKDVEFVFRMSEGQFPQMIMRNTAVDGQRQETVVET